MDREKLEGEIRIEGIWRTEAAAERERERERDGTSVEA